VCEAQANHAITHTHIECVCEAHVCEARKSCVCKPHSHHTHAVIHTHRKSCALISFQASHTHCISSLTHSFHFKPHTHNRKSCALISFQASHTQSLQASRTQSCNVCSISCHALKYECVGFALCVCMIVCARDSKCVGIWRGGGLGSSTVFKN